MTVGVVAYRYEYYPYVRNIIDIVPGIQYRKAKDLFSKVNAGARLLNRLAQREIAPTFDLNNQFYDFNLNKVDLLHFFNGISYGHTPWVSTFETVLPRFQSVIQVIRNSTPGVRKDWKLDRALRALAGPHCKRIIAVSDCTAHMQHDLLSGFGRYQDSIEEKLVVLNPPQDILVSRFDEKQVTLDSQIKFMFVGSAFFRKGGIEMIDTIKHLRDEYHYDIELTVVSDLRNDMYAVPVEPETVKRTKEFLQENREWIKYYPQLPNPSVLDLMKKVHVGLLPTYADTYGYSVLEFQAAGCPVITTNVRSLPEINNNDKGWMIEVPKNRLGEAIYETKDDRLAISTMIRKGLGKVVHEIFADRSIIPVKSEKSILSIKTNHSKADFSAKMGEIYRNAIS